ncbi:MAG TPA: Flp pilus assembly protein CpaB [Firmicutes bacterium]|nr:Flp pilus assembly protein CpaB [Bacillota bacterium]
MRGRRLILLMAVLLGTLSAVVSYHYLKGITASMAENALPKMVRAVVATKRIPPRTSIESDMVYLKDIPQDLLGSDTVTSLQDAVGAVTRTEILPGEQVRQSRLLKKGESAGLALSIPPGKRAVTLGMNEAAGVGGFVKPMDRVDVLGTFNASVAGTDTAVTVVKDAEVLAVSQEMQDKDREKARIPTSVTLAVSPQEAERLALAEEIGTLKLALRPVAESGRLLSASSTGVESTTRKILAKSRVTTADILQMPVRTETPRPSPIRVTAQVPQTVAQVPQSVGSASHAGAATHVGAAVNVGAAAYGGAVEKPVTAGKSEVVKKPKVVEIIRGVERSYVTLGEASEGHE